MPSVMRAVIFTNAALVPAMLSRCHAIPLVQCIQPLPLLATHTHTVEFWYMVVVG